MASPCRRTGPISCRSISSLFSAILLTIAAPAHADPYQEFTGARSEAMGGAHRGLATSNDTIVLNPAGVALLRRYSIDTAYGYSGQDSLSYIHVSALDSKTGPVPGALGYTYSRGDHAGSDVDMHRFYVVTGYRILENLAFGVLARHIRGSFRDENRVKQNVESFSTDVGISLVLFNVLGFGATYHNLFSSSRKRFNPPHLGFGLAYAGQTVAIATDVEVDLRQAHFGEVAFSAGLEYFFADQFPLRFGYRLRPWIRKRDGVKDLESFIGGGVGWVDKSGSAEVTFTQSVNIKKNWDFIASLKFFL